MATPAPALSAVDQYRQMLLQIWIIATTRPDLFANMTQDQFRNDPLPGDTVQYAGTPQEPLVRNVLATAVSSNAQEGNNFDKVRNAFAAFAAIGWDPTEHGHPGCTEFSVDMTPQAAPAQPAEPAAGDGEDV